MPQSERETEGIKVVATNRRAWHDYFIDEKVEAGLALTGTEIKSIRAGRVNLRDAYANIDKGEAWLMGAHIAPYDHGNRYNHEPTRPRKLLLHKSEIGSLRGKITRPGFTLIPLQVYLKRGRAKVELGLARGKRSFDKRETIARRDAQREIDRAVADRRRRNRGSWYVVVGQVIRLRTRGGERHLLQANTAHAGHAQRQSQCRLWNWRISVSFWRSTGCAAGISLDPLKRGLRDISLRTAGAAIGIQSATSP